MFKFGKSVIYPVLNVCKRNIKYPAVSCRFDSSGPSSNLAELENFSSPYGQDHQELKKTVRKIIDQDINPFVDQWEEEELYPAHEIFQKLGKAGLLGITRPVEYGGLGLDYTYQVAFLEELANINCGGIPMSIGVHTDCSTPALARFGSEELKKEYLVPAIAGDTVSCIGVSEVTGGSDVANIKTTAVRKGDDYIINGGKMWITNGCQADWMCLLANTSQSKGASHKNKSLIILPLNLPGIHVAKKLKKIGMRSSDTGQLFFEDVRVPAKNLIGEEGMGFVYQMLQFQEERMAGIAGGLGAMKRILNETTTYLKERQAFGQPLISNQYLHYRLAELHTEVEALQSLMYRAIASMVKGENVTLLATMGKLKSARLACQINDFCVQCWGGMGYLRETPIGRAFVDGRLWSIGAGTDEVMLSIICKFMDILPPPDKK